MAIGIRTEAGIFFAVLEAFLKFCKVLRNLMASKSSATAGSGSGGSGASLSGRPRPVVRVAADWVLAFWVGFGSTGRGFPGFGTAEGGGLSGGRVGRPGGRWFPTALPHALGEGCGVAGQ